MLWKAGFYALIVGRMNFSTRLDDAMRKAGFKSQSALARAAGISQTTVNRLLKSTGTHGPDTETVKALSEACRVSFEWLMNGTPSKKKKTFEEVELVYLTKREIRLFTQYRESTIEGKQLIEDIALTAPKIKDSLPD
ncbi:helix-turn-helix domain-containing protein [Undibacterium sp. TC9W]|uniref:helix-turn-helix domain-containing protein n=1 Tax=Undibacterium sp. TC9W TaxID=3413053 RepID=UPI003BF1034C